MAEASVLKIFCQSNQIYLDIFEWDRLLKTIAIHFFKFMYFSTNASWQGNVHVDNQITEVKWQGEELEYIQYFRI